MLETNNLSDKKNNVSNDKEDNVKQDVVEDDYLDSNDNEMGENTESLTDKDIFHYDIN